MFQSKYDKINNNENKDPRLATRFNDVQLIPIKSMIYNVPVTFTCKYLHTCFAEAAWCEIRLHSAATRFLRRKDGIVAPVVSRNDTQRHAPDTRDKSTRLPRVMQTKMKSQIGRNPRGSGAQLIEDKGATAQTWRGRLVRNWIMFFLFHGNWSFLMFLMFLMFLKFIH